jgi:hypothetical protein
VFYVKRDLLQDLAIVLLLLLLTCNHLPKPALNLLSPRLV